MQQNKEIDVNSMRSKAFGLTTCIAQSVELFLHYGRGAQSLFTGGTYGIVFLAVFEFWMVMLFPQDNPYPLPLFAAAYVAACIGHRVSVGGKGRVDVRYTGKPILGLVLPLDEGIIKVLEPLAVIGAGAGVYHAFSRPLGLYLMLAGAMLLPYIFRAVSQERRERAKQRSEKSRSLS